MPINSGDRVRITNLMSLTTALLTLGYLSYYWIGLNSFSMAKVNAIFALAYLVPVILNKFNLYLYAKSLLFIILIVHVSLLSVVTFTLASGFHLYLLLVVPGVYIVFDYKDKVYKTSLVFIALAAIMFCEYYDNQAPLIMLSAEASRMMFQSTIVIIVLELLLINHLSTRDAEKREAIDKELKRLDSIHITPANIGSDEAMQIIGKTLTHEYTLSELLRRPDIKYQELMKLPAAGSAVSDEKVAEQVEIQVKYQGYIQRQQEEISRQAQYENTKLPQHIDYNQIHGLSNEAIQKLSQQKPQTIGEASRISGITPATISLLLVHIKRGFNHNKRSA